MINDKLFNMPFAKVYPLYVAKALKKQRSQEEVNMIISWLTGYQLQQIEQQANSDITLHDFFTYAPHMNPKRHEIKGSICGVRVEAIEDTLLQDIRYLDKLIDELAKGKSMDKILRK